MWKTYLNSLGLELPEVSTPGGSYQSVNVRGAVAYVAIQFPILNGEFRYQGILGKDLTTEDGRLAMQLCALNVLAQIEAKIGMHNLEGLNHLEVHYVAQAPWDDAPLVVDAASELMLGALGEKGVHSRTIVGVQHLPRQFCVGLTTSFNLLK